MTVSQDSTLFFIRWISLVLSKLCRVLLQAQPRRTLPMQTMFELLKQPFDAYPGLYHMLSSIDFLACLFLLLSSPATANNSAIFGAVKDVLVCLMSRSSGLKYLCAHYETVNGIIRALTQTQVRQMSVHSFCGAGFCRTRDLFVI